MKLGKVGVVVAARTSSSRLPGKALLPLQELPMIVFLMRRLRGLRSGVVVLATTDLSADDELVAIVSREGVPVFRGANADVVARYVGAAQHFGFGTVARITGDCPFVNAELIDHCVEHAMALHDFELATTKTRFPVGLDAELYRAADMAALHGQGMLTAADREHLTLYYYDHHGRGCQLRYIDPKPEWVLTGRQFTVDTRGDYEAAMSLAGAFADWRFSLAELARVAHGVTA